MRKTEEDEVAPAEEVRYGADAGADDPDAEVVDLLDMVIPEEQEEQIKQSLEEKTKYKVVAPTWELNIETYGYGKKRKTYDPDYEHVESISKLEKADVLELTVNHLRKLKRQQMLSLNPALDVDRFHAGYSACAAEVGRVLASQPGVE